MSPHKKLLTVAIDKFHTAEHNGKGVITNWVVVYETDEIDGDGATVVMSSGNPIATLGLLTLEASRIKRNLT